MKENLLHFIWKLQLFSKKELQCTSGEKLQVLSAGIHNFDSGPDFFNAKIAIGEQIWAGNIEIHINSSDWYIHNHEVDENYDAVILHVVWEHDIDIFRKSNQTIPTLELKKYISKDLLNRHSELFSKNKKWINCENDISKIKPFLLSHWFERLYFERLESKTEIFIQVLSKTKNNWEATLFVLLAKNFGLKINSDAFFNFANSFDFSILRKVSNSQNILEALFFGQAGLLFEDYESEYFRRIKKEYDYLKIKHNLSPILKNQIRFFRLRPGNFPTIRLSQLASLYFKNQNIFSKIIDIEDVNEFYKLFDVSCSEFWKTHYTFKTESKKSAKKLTKSFIDLLLINTIIPIKFLYLKSQGKSDYSSVISIIEQIKPEKNSIISKFSECKINAKNAFETQALIHLKNCYCKQNLCLQCEIGRELLKT